MKRTTRIRKKTGLYLLVLLMQVAMAKAQTSDDQFRLPLQEVLQLIQSRYGITIRYPAHLVQDKWVNYALWRFSPNAEQTLKAVLATQDISYVKESVTGYKLQAYQYHLKTVQEGKDQLDWLSSSYKNRQAWERRKDTLRQCLLSALRLQSLPQKTSVPVLVSPVRKYKGYSVQNIAIETLPGLFVCGSLYRPLKIKGRIPVILNPDGHFSRGRYREDCQYRCAAQARMGAMAFSYDLFGWEGESILQVDPKDHRRSLVHSIQALHALRILDYLLSLPQADPLRVGITGASGGGSQSILMSAIDNRIQLSVPVAMLSSYHSGGCPCESGMGVHLCGNGTNNVEIAAIMAPKPQLVISDGMDWTRHVPEIEFPFLQQVYGFFDQAQHVQNEHLPAEGHDYGFSKRKALYEFLARQFGLDLSKVRNKEGLIDETDITIEKDNQLKVFGDKGEKLPAHAVKGYERITALFEAAIQSTK